MEFRRKYDCDQLLQTYKPPEVLDKYYVGGVCGFDKEGCPIWLDPFTLLDFKGRLLPSDKKSPISKRFVWTKPNSAVVEIQYRWHIM